MPTELEQVNCPRFPDHGLVITRRLLPSERQMINGNEEAEVFEIQCPECGTYEYREDETTP